MNRDDDYSDCFDRPLPSEKGRKGRSGNNNNSKNYSDFKLYGAPIKFLESIGVIVGLASMVYLLYVSNTFFVEGEIKNMPGIILFFIMSCLTLIKRSIADIAIKSVNDFKEQFGYKETRKIITTSDQISFLMNLAISALRSWKIAWLVYTAFVMVLYIIAFYVGLLMTVIMLLMLLFITALKVPEILNNLAKYFRSKTKNIPADPPSIGVMTLFENPLEFDLILDAGTAIIYPGVIGFLTVEVHQEPEDFEEMSGFFAKGNIPVKVKGMQIQYKPEITELKEFVSAKKQEGVRDALKNLIADKLRKIIARYEFDELIGERKDGDKESIIDILELEIKQYLTGELDPEKLELMAINGIRDAHLLGIKIYRIAISSIETTDEYLKEMVAAAAELKQREAERRDSETETIQADIYFEAYERAGESKTFDQCLKMVMDNKLIKLGEPVTPGKREFYESANLQKLAPAILEIVKELKK